MLSPAEIASFKALIDLAFLEDLNCGVDVTSEALIPDQAQGAASIVAREPGVACGFEGIPLVIERFAADFRVQPIIKDGERVDAGTVAAVLEGRTIDILKAERTILNFLGRLSGVSTLTRRFVDETAGTKAKIFDTRKTTPGWRLLEKYAVKCGGGNNHRMGLYDAVLIKDNHLAAVESHGGSTGQGVNAIAQAIATIRAQQPELTIQVEVDTLEQLEAILPFEPDIILLDNMSSSELSRAVDQRGVAPVELEASGGVNLLTVKTIALTGVDRISVGALTHSAINFDWGLDWSCS